MNRPNWIGQILGGRYRIDEIIGQGGMSAVYKAYDPNLKRVVAIKMIHSHLADDPLFVKRFEEEAAAVAQLRHPNIVQVYDFNHDGDLYYMVQEFVPGETLQERLRRLNRTGRRMSPAEAMRYALNICDASGYAHRRGMIHRDIKPANIMLDVQDQAILMDFGIVKITGGERHTATGAVVGTAQYLPPELIRGEVADARSDIYSLGVTLFEMVNGRPPFESDSAMSLMMMHVNDPVPDMRTLRPEVPEELIAVIEKSLEKDPSRRYSSMDEMGAALRALPSQQGKTTRQDMKTAIETPEITATAPVPGGKASFEEQVKPAPVPIGVVSKPVAIPEGIARTPDPAQGLSPASASASPAGAMPARKGNPPLIWIVAAGAMLLVVVIAVIALTRGGGGNNQGSELVTQTQSLAGLPLAAVTSQPSPSATATNTVTVTPSPSLTPTETQVPTPTLSPTPTIPVGVPFSLINDITVDDQGRYIVDYETFEYNEQLPGNHVHFFFNTLAPEHAGYPSNANWYVWGGPQPFNGYLVSNRPEFATQMCILVANPDHSVQPNSGNCFLLPGVPVVTPVMQLDCLAGPDTRYPAVTSLTPEQPALVLGISADESWWNVANPLDTTQNCWLPQNLTLFNGDISILPLVSAPPLPEGPSVEILAINVDDQGNYVVEYETHNYTEQLPGTHMHFFFNTVPPDQVGASGAGVRLMHGGPTPFSGYKTSDRPADATQMCVLVANPDHSIIPDSGNCMDLPDSP